jgi:hypothetical protein
MAQGTSYQVQLSGGISNLYDTIAVDGVVDLSGGPTLSIELNYNAPPGQTFTIMEVAGASANAIVGRFANAPEAAAFVSNGRNYSIAYNGGDGNDVVITLLEPSVRSRKLQGGGAFDVTLPIVEPAGTECRSGGPAGDFSLIFTFADPIVSVGGATVTSGVASVSSHGIGPQPNQYTVNLTGVNNAQRVTVSLTNISAGGRTIASASGTMRVLLGDTNNDGTVNTADALQTRSRSGQSADATNFRSDVNGDGFINTADALIVRSRSGTNVP